MLTRLNLQGNSNIGLLCLATDGVILAPVYTEDSEKKVIEETMDLEVLKMTIGGTSLIGALCCANSKNMLVSNIITHDELDILSSLNMKIDILDSNLNAAGNNILLNDNAAFISSDYWDKEIKNLKDILGIPVKKGKLWELTIPGSAAVVTNTGLLCHPKFSDNEMEKLKELFGVEGVKRGTVNRGSPLIGAGCIVNNNGSIAGEQTTGIELGRIDDIFGFIDKN